MKLKYINKKIKIEAEIIIIIRQNSIKLRNDYENKIVTKILIVINSNFKKSNKDKDKYKIKAKIHRLIGTITS